MPHVNNKQTATADTSESHNNNDLPNQSIKIGNYFTFEADRGDGEGSTDENGNK